MLSRKSSVKKKLRISIIAILIIFTNPFLFNTLLVKWQPAPTVIGPHVQYDAGIILGGMGAFDKHHQWFFGGTADRFIQTEELYHKGIIKKIIVSGGVGKLLTEKDEPVEATALQQELISSGIPASDIIIETKSRNTFENATYSKEILSQLHLKEPLILITSAMHMPRASAVFKKAGITTIAYPCDYKGMEKKLSITDFIPSEEPLAGWPSFIKEIIGYQVYKLTGKA